jgi:uncharacterized protein YndB with AHSA1/START domain
MEPGMNLTFTVGGRISKPVSEVFEAVVNPDHLSRFFTTGGAKGRLETGAVVTWDFHDFPGAFPVQVVEVEKDRRIVLRWDAADKAAEPDASGAPHHRDHDLRAAGRRPDPGAHLRGGLVADAGRAVVLLRQLRGLDRNALRHEGLARARDQPAQCILQVAY